MTLVLNFLNFSAYHLYGDIFQQDRYRAIVTHDGSVRITYSGSMQTICVLDITHFPFDEQICHIEFDMWSMSMALARFSDDSVIATSNLRENGIWRFTDIWIVFTDDHYIDETFRTISYSFR